MKIVVNGGHYPGLDSGAVGVHIDEADVTKNVMELVCVYLRAAGYEVMGVQENELSEIVDASNDFAADLFVSVHCNGAESPLAFGTETYFYSDYGRRLAECIQKQIVDDLEMEDRGVKENQIFYVLKYTDAIAVLVEMAFITNAEDEEKLMDKQESFAKAIGRGIVDYMMLQDME